MSVSINKDTKIFGSFSKSAGNRGCEFFNRYFSEYGVNAIYKSFSVDNIQEALKAAKTLTFSGCAVAMPHKKPAYDLMTYLDVPAVKSKSINTIVFNHDKDEMFGYNTDYYGVIKILEPYLTRHKSILILGNGGLSGAVQAASSDLGFEIKVMTRSDWNINDVRDSLVYNCTPLQLMLDSSNCYIDCLIGSAGGDLLQKYQARKQFELYTGIIINEV